MPGWIKKILLQAGADSQTRDNQGFTALIWAAYQGYDDVVSVMLTQGVDTTMRTKGGRTALIWAVKAGRLDTVECFLESGNADLEIRDGSGFTALIHAANNGHIDIAKTFIEAGVDLHAQDENGETALSKASRARYTEIVDILQKARATN